MPYSSQSLPQIRFQYEPKCRLCRRRRARAKTQIRLCTEADRSPGLHTPGLLCLFTRQEKETMRLMLIAALVVLTRIVVDAQDFPRKELNLEEMADRIFPVQDLDLNYEELYENLAQLLTNPLDLNAVNAEQLRALFVLNEQEINAFLDYRGEYGPLLSAYELQAVPGWDRSIFDRIIPFVTVLAPEHRLDMSVFRRLSLAQTHYLILRYDRVIEPKEG